MIKPLLAAFAVALLSVSAPAQVVSWAKLEGQNSRIAQARTVAVADAASWEKVWKEHSDEALPGVDFSKESVVAVFLGETRTAGVKVEIVVQNDMIDSNRLNVFYKEVRSASNPFVAMRICQPFAMVKVRKAAVVSFESDTLVSIP
ncbi:MAG: hypothetical protein Q7J64_04025, partial [Elusimicrobiota bacterium]|nr:hypothetical protein [Elusimicrobiota bacterium]